MYGVMKGKNKDRGNPKNKPVESKIIKKQIAPVIQPVIQMAPKDVVVIGSTHVVEMVGHSLFNGREGSHLPNQGIFLRQGTRVVVDDETNILSRRGPNQRLFREEDRDRGTHIYRWVRVVAIEGENVSDRNLYIREGTFRDKAFMAGKVLSPPSGGVIPSVDAAPGTRHMPLLRPPGPDEEGQDILTPEQRSLNRLARGEWVNLTGKKSEKTPHLAMMIWGGKIYVSGNTDRVVPIEVLQGSVVDKLTELIGKTKGPFKAKRVKMERKLRRIGQGEYHNDDYQNNEMMVTIRNAIQNPDRFIEVIGAGQVGEEIIASAPVHGEMLFLDTLYDEYLQRRIENPRRRLKKIFVGGSLQDCIFCHWAFDIFNQLIGIKIGVIIVSSGTHGKIPSSWIIPRWMREMDGAERQFIETVNRYGIECNIQGNILTTSYSDMKDTMLPESDSE